MTESNNRERSVMSVSIGGSWLSLAGVNIEPEGARHEGILLSPFSGRPKRSAGMVDGPPQLVLFQNKISERLHGGEEALPGAFAFDHRRAVKPFRRKHAC